MFPKITPAHIARVADFLRNANSSSTLLNGAYLTTVYGLQFDAMGVAGPKTRKRAERIRNQHHVDQEFCDIINHNFTK